MLRFVTDTAASLVVASCVFLGVAFLPVRILRAVFLRQTFVLLRGTDVCRTTLGKAALVTNYAEKHGDRERNVSGHNDSGQAHCCGFAALVKTWVIDAQ